MDTEAIEIARHDLRTVKIMLKDYVDYLEFEDYGGDWTLDKFMEYLLYRVSQVDECLEDCVTSK